MKPVLPILLLTSLLFIFTFPKSIGQAQKIIYQPPVSFVDFGNSTNTSSIPENLSSRYRQRGNSCPDDGNYAYVPETLDCFEGRWIRVLQDHTSGDAAGNMMVVNAREEPGTFLQYKIENIKGNTDYELSLWVLNICLTATGCTPTPPDILFTIETTQGLRLKSYRTGSIQPTGKADWRQFRGKFKTPAGTNGIVITLSDDTRGGCGNDFAIDDIVVREFKMETQQEPIPQNVIAPNLKKDTKPVAKTVAPPVPEKKNETVKKEITQQETPPIEPEKVQKKEIEPIKKIAQPKRMDPEKAIPKIWAPIPEVLKIRSNPLVKEFFTDSAEIRIELYDNGTIDGDTISVYVNNKPVILHGALTEKPIKLTLKVDRNEPYHEIIMVADNLGSIPPNTSLMLITAGDKRYQVFISSNEQKNAKVVIRLNE